MQMELPQPGSVWHEQVPEHQIPDHRNIKPDPRMQQGILREDHRAQDHWVEHPNRRHHDDQRAAFEDPRRDVGRGADPRIVREEPRDHRTVREDPRLDTRACREDFRLETRAGRDDPRSDPRHLRDDPRLDSRAGREDPQFNLRAGRDVVREDTRTLRGPMDELRVPHDVFHGHQPPHMSPHAQPHLSPQYMAPQNQQGTRSVHPYKLPWEEELPEDYAPPEYSNPNYGESEKMGTVDARRRSHRRQVHAEDTPTTTSLCDGGDRFHHDRIAPGMADRGPSTNHGRNANVMGPTSSKAARVNENANPGGGTMGFTPAMGPSVAMRHGATAGTGGSEEWPATQVRIPQTLREPEYESEKAGMPRRKPGRQPGLVGVSETPTRRSPDLPMDPRQEAWRGDQTPAELGCGLGGLPSIHGGFLSGPVGIPETSSGSRAPSRLNASTPTQREEDSLDCGGRQLHCGHVGHGGHGFTGGGRWGASTAGQDWPGLAMPGLPGELGPVRDPRGGHHDGAVRAPPPTSEREGHRAGQLASLGRLL